ncbi:E3 ubiquitin-protein ligase ATL4-like [Zingiber officinale]|uniref:RING-type E3 ubiquitin transferase n=1 Tax=Zingiber officinale TaxID=94328 RepID=A0A8J5IM73_ZINOF|nr:E3 ubiquitin-protein ligase ATL4-like [Zingiber officinale]KAG6537709.1 hypothetical protein ZIOFF_002804 [Zingiber officinale]
MNDDLLRPPPPPILKHPPLAVDPKQFPPPVPSSSSSISLGWTLLIISAIVGFSFLACFFIRLVLRLRRSYSAVASDSFLDPNEPSGPAAADDSARPSEKKLNSVLIDSLPLYSLGSALSALSKSSPDCAVCLRSFRPGEDLRLLPACFHSFHAGCVDTWIQNSPSCPLCRAPVTLPQPPLSAAPPPPVKMTSSGVQARSFPEGESRNISLPSPLASPPSRLLYSIGNDPMEEDIEEALVRISSSRMSSPGDEVAAATAGGEPTRWLRDCTDRQLSSRSSSFPSAASSFEYSGRWAVNQEDFGGSWAIHQEDFSGP